MRRPGPGSASSETIFVDGAEYLRRKMAAEGRTARALAEEMGVHPQTLYNVTTKRRPMSFALAVKLGRRFVEPVELWLSDKIAIDASSELMRESEGGKAGFGPSFSVVDAPDDVSGIQIDRQIRHLLETEDSGVRITPFDAEQVQPASYDLTVGLVVRKGFEELSRYEWSQLLKLEYQHDELPAGQLELLREVREKKGARIDYSREAVIERGESVLIVARETVAFDKYHLAVVGSTARNAIRGLLVTHGFQIDPGYSGPMFATAMNIGASALAIEAGEKLLSLAIERLRHPPQRAYLEEIETLVGSVAAALWTQLRGLFEFKQLKNGGYKADSSFPYLSFACTNLEDAETRAVAAVVGALERSSGKINPDIAKAVRETLDSVTIDWKQTDALIRHFSVTDPEIIKAAKDCFIQPQDEHTLLDTFLRLKLDPHAAVIRLME